MSTATAPRTRKSTKKASSRPADSAGTTKVDGYQVITDKVIALLEQGVAPWRQPWDSAVGAPLSMSTKKAYRGINVLLLGMAALERGYVSPWWGTYAQIAGRGGQVRKGEKGTQVVLWKTFSVPDKADPTKTKTIPTMRLFTVFNAEQADGDLGLPVTERAPRTEIEVIDEIETAVAPYEATLAAIRTGSAAFYRPATDVLTLPARETFHSTSAYYDVRFHELGHSTGHSTRLDREGVAEFDHFGSQRYAREELVAQMTAAFLSGHFGLLPETAENTAAYLQSWIEALKNDKKMIVSAAGRAQKAADLILGRQDAAEAETAA
jgi:antirestriction protein ArdC